MCCTRSRARARGKVEHRKGNADRVTARNIIAFLVAAPPGTQVKVSKIPKAGSKGVDFYDDLCKRWSAVSGDAPRIPL